MIKVPGEFGSVANFIDEKDLQDAVRILKSFPSNPATTGICHGVSIDHKGYLWFKKTMMTRLEKYFGRDLKLVFGMYLDLYKPFTVHSDIRPCEGEVYASCLIPVSVDNNPELCNLAHTKIYHESDAGGTPPPANPTERAICTWNRGDLIWWHTPVFHCSGDFVNFDTKQCIVVHTYV